jgi:hypothetical protein
MRHSLRTAAGLLIWTAVCFPSPVEGQAPSSVRKVQVLHNQNVVEIEIEASDRLVPQTQLLTGPDRLVVDFPNAVPGVQLRNQAVNRKEVKSVRTSLFSSRPPVTRIVFDLNGPQHYQIFPYGRTVMVRVGGIAGAETAGLNPPSEPASERTLTLGLVNATYPPQPVRASEPPPPPTKPPLRVLFERGLLTINANKASLSEVLFAVHQRTGADIAIPAGAEQEQVVADIGPAPAPEVLAHLLNGSKFNFLIMSSSTNPGALDRVILSARTEGLMPLPMIPPPQAQARQDENAESEAPPQANPPEPPSNPSQPPPGPPETRAPQGNDVPD